MQRAFHRPGRSVARDFNPGGGYDVPIKRRLGSIRFKVPVKKVGGFVVVVRGAAQADADKSGWPLPEKEFDIFSCPRVISNPVSDDPVPRALRITEAPGLDQELQSGFCRAATLRWAKPPDKSCRLCS